MGTETARLQERLEAALGPGWNIGREVRRAPRLQHPHDLRTPTEVGTALGTPAYVMPDQVMGDPAMDHCADLYALGAMRTDSSWGRIRSLAERPNRARSLRRSRQRRRGVRRHLEFGMSTRKLVFPPPTGGRFK